MTDQRADHVDTILEQWHRERPDLDAAPMGVIGRLHRIAVLLDERLRPVFAEEGLAPGEFDLLAALRRVGAPYALTPREIGASTMITSGAVTKRVDRLLAAGLVERRVATEDGRSRPVGLTAAGLALVDRLVARHLANEEALLDGLNKAEREDLARLLRTWSLALDV